MMYYMSDQQIVVHKCGRKIIHLNIFTHKSQTNVACMFIGLCSILFTLSHQSSKKSPSEQDFYLAEIQLFLEV